MTPWPPPRRCAISAGHQEAAAAILTAAGLDGLSNEELEDLCDRFGVET